MKLHLLRGLLPAVLVMLAGALCGCEAKTKVIQYPTFYTSDLKTVAVVPFRNQSQDQNAGDIVSDRLANGISATETYKVYNRNDLKALMDEKDLQLVLCDDTAQAADAFKRIGKVQALLTGTVTTFSTTTRSEPRQEPIYGYTRNGGMYIAGYRNYVFTRNEATVSVTANLIRVSDGTTIYAMATPAECTWYAEGSPPGLDPHGCLASATDKAIAKLVEEFSVVQKEVKLPIDKCCRLASDYYDGKWEYTDSFSLAKPKMFAVIMLPANCDRNSFRLTVVRKDQRTDLAEVQFTWDRKDSEQKGKGFELNARDIAEKGGGPGDYTLKFYSGPEPIITRNFHISEK
jgi:hypothetical protein